MAQSMELWSLASRVDDVAALPTPPNGSRAVPYESISDIDGPSGPVNFHAITRMAAYETKSFEELRVEDAVAQYMFRPPLVQEFQPTTLLERDVLRAVGEVVLNERHWWADRQDNAAWKRKKQAISMRVARATLEDAAAHVVGYMARVARELAETVTPEALKLSLLLDKWPTTSDAACLESPTSTSLFRPMPSESVPFCDRYLVLAWVMLRGICKRDEVAWPEGWGATSCSCYTLRSLVDAIAGNGVRTLKALIDQHEDGLDVLPEDVEAILLAENANATEWLVEALFESVVSIRTDMKMTESWTTRYVLALLNDQRLKRSTENDTVVVPAPFPGAFMVDDVALPQATEPLAADPLVVEFEASADRQQVKLTTQGVSKINGIDLEQLLSSLMPAFAKTHAAAHSTANPIVDHAIGIPGRPALVTSQKLANTSFVFGVDKKPSRVIVDVETLTIPAQNGGIVSSDWHYNASIQAIDSVEIDATAVICLNPTNVSTPVLQIQSLSTNQEVPSTSSSHALFVRSAQASTCSETNAGIFSVSALPGRAVVLPPASQYRVVTTELDDPANPGSVVVVRVALVSPKCTIPSLSIAAGLQKAPVLPEWLEDLQLKARDKTLSADEARFAHYQRDTPRIHQEEKKKVVASGWSPPAHLLAKPAVSAPESSYQDKEVLNRIMQLTNTPQWWETRWVEGSASRREWEQELESYYLHEKLRYEVWKGYAGMVKNLNARATEAETKSEEGADNQSADSFARVAKLFSRIAMLREAHRGFLSSEKTDQSQTSAQVVVELVQKCRNAESIEAQAQILSDFIGVGYPVSALLEPLSTIWDEINADVKKWMQRVIGVVDSRRLALLRDGGVYSPTQSTWVLDGAVAQVVKADLVKALEPLLCEALSKSAEGATELRLVDSMCSVLDPSQSVPTFSVPRIGSLENRLASIIVQNGDGDPSDERVSHMIPSEVAFDLDGKAHFVSYISNVFPRAHRDLYKSMDAIATAFVPLFEKLLGDGRFPRRLPNLWSDEDSNILATPTKPPGSFSLRGRVLQTAVEIVQIDLNAEAPRSSGNNWHRNTTKQGDYAAQDIIATGVYVAVVDNVSLPRVSFVIDPRLSPVCFVDGYADRCFVFSNMLDHKMEPCELVDKTRPGTALLVKLHVINERTPLLSTANVRPSQREWIVDYTLGDVSRFFHLPAEVHDVIESMLEWDGLTAAELSAVSAVAPSGFAAPSTAPSGPFGGFGSGTPTTGFGFGQQAATPPTGFGFGQQAATPPTGFGFGQQAATPPTEFGFGRAFPQFAPQVNTPSSGVFVFSPPANAPDTGGFSFGQTHQHTQADGAGGGFRFGSS